ncbi:ANK3 [Symbiodinium microadriaticum]|nr:ANK3 [Symbiodinium microadriaticum]
MNYHDDSARYQILELLAWSLEAMGTGRHPDRDPYGRLFNGSYFPDRYKLANEPLTADNMRGIYDGLQADLEFVKRVLYLQRALAYSSMRLNMHC